MSIIALAEGKTEEKILQKLNVITPKTQPIFASSGKQAVLDRLKNEVFAVLGDEPIRLLILLDLDTHEEETIETIVQRVTDRLRHAFIERKYDGSLVTLSCHSDFPNVYKMSLDQPDIRLALHIANDRWCEDFIKTTIDDYVLALALKPGTADEFARDLGIKNGDQLIKKITQEIPDVLNHNEIKLVEAKDYVRLYAAVIKAHTSPAVFAEKTLSHAPKEEIDKTFASLLAAVKVLGVSNNA